MKAHRFIIRNIIPHHLQIFLQRCPAKLFLVSCLAWLLGAGSGAGCTAPDVPPKKFDSSARLDRYSWPDFPATCPVRSTLGPPRPETIQSPTKYNPLPIRGQAPGAVTVLAQGPAGAAQPARVSNEWKFCTEVWLTPHTSNSITLVSVDANGCRGMETLVSIQHQSEVSSFQSPTPCQ